MGLKSVSSPSVDVSRMLNSYTPGLDGTPKVLPSFLVSFRFSFSLVIVSSFTLPSMLTFSSLCFQEITGMTSYFKVIDKAVSNLILDASSDQGWEKIGTKNDISVWKRANHSFALHYTKSVGVLPGTPQFITTCIVDHEQQLQWDPLLKEGQSRSLIYSLILSLSLSLSHYLSFTHSSPSPFDSSSHSKVGQTNGVALFELSSQGLFFEPSQRFLCSFTLLRKTRWKFRCDCSQY
jgi:hypothetical protein